MWTDSPRIKSFSIDKCCVIVIADVISAFHFSGAVFGDEVSVHDYISKHRTGVTLHERAGDEKKKGNAKGKHCLQNNLKWISNKNAKK